MLRTLATFSLLWALSSMGQTLQDREPPLHRIVHRNTFGLRFNPLGLLYEGRFIYRMRLYESRSIALRDNFLGIGLTPSASPAFVRAGAYIEVQPLTVLGLWASFTFVQYFGTFNLFQSFPNATANYSDAQLSRLGALERGPLGPGHYVTSGTELTLGLDFQVKVLNYVARAKARLVRADMRLRENDSVYYDQFFDVLAPNRGFHFTNDSDVLYQSPDKRFTAGVRYTFSLPFYETRHVAPGAAAGVSNATHRIGPLVAYTFKSDDGALFNMPTVFLLVQWWLQNPNRTGRASNADGVSQAIPLMGVGFQMTGDFLPLAPSTLK